MGTLKLCICLPFAALSGELLLLVADAVGRTVIAPAVVPVGIVVVIGIPVLLYIAYDVTRITLNNRRIKAAEAAKQAEKESEKDEEIRRLRELLAEKDGAAEQAEGEKSAERSSDSGEEAAEEGAQQRAPQGAAEGDPPEGTEESAPPAEK